MCEGRHTASSCFPGDSALPMALGALPHPLLSAGGSLIEQCRCLGLAGASRPLQGCSPSAACTCWCLSCHPQPACTHPAGPAPGQLRGQDSAKPPAASPWQHRRARVRTPCPVVLRTGDGQGGAAARVRVPPADLLRERLARSLCTEVRRGDAQSVPETEKFMVM